MSGCRNKNSRDECVPGVSPRKQDKEKVRNEKII